MFNVITAFKDIANFSKGLIEYFSLKDKVLWENNGTAWDVSSLIKIPNIKKYETLLITPVLNNGDHKITLHWDSKRNLFTGTGLIGYEAWTASQTISLSVDTNNNVRLMNRYWLGHHAGTIHDSMQNSYTFTKITGFEPKIPESLQAFIGGG